MSIDSLVTKYANVEALYHKAKDRGWQISAVEEFSKEWAEQFDSSKRHRATGQSMEAFIETYERERPHIFLPDASKIGDAHLQYAAFGEHPTLAARAALLKSLNGDIDSYNFIATSWNSDTSKLQPGTAPGNFDTATAGLKAKQHVEELRKQLADAEEIANVTAPRANSADRASNPWSQAGWNMTKQSSLVRAVGAEKGARIAASVGCVLGSTRPNPAYNK